MSKQKAQRVVALYEAGWSVSRIAHELHAQILEVLALVRGR